MPAFWASWADPLQMVHERHPVIGLKQRALDGVLSAEVHAFQTMKQWKWSLAQCGEVDDLSCGTPPPSIDNIAFSGRSGASSLDVPKAVQLREQRWLLHRRTIPHALMQISFVCCFSDAFVCFCLLSLALAGVAIFSILLATTAQHAAETGVFGRRGFALESAVARICREAGARVSTNVCVRDLDLTAPNVERWSTTAQCSHDELRCKQHVGVKNALTRNLWVFAPVLSWWCLAGEVAGRWSAEIVTSSGCWQRPSSEPSLLRRRVESAWRLRWSSMLSCAAARAFAGPQTQWRWRWRHSQPWPTFCRSIVMQVWGEACCFFVWFFCGRECAVHFFYLNVCKKKSDFGHMLCSQTLATSPFELGTLINV